MYAVIDIESNGGSFRKEKIIEIAIYKYDGHNIVDQFISLVNPEAEITAFVQKLTGITSKMVRTAPKFHEIARRIVEITEGSTLVGHNIDFDYRMLRQSFKELGYDFKTNILDTILLAQKLIPDAESYALGKLVKSLGIPLSDHHRAAGDARATLSLFQLLMSKDINNEIIQMHFEENNAKTYVNKIKLLTQDLPRKKGILYFQSAEGDILSSIFVDDLHKTAKKIFHSKAKKFKKIQEQTEQIHYEVVTQPIIAKLLMKSKGTNKKTELPYGLFYRNQTYIVEKNSLNKAIPLIKFKSFTQAIKALNYIEKIPMWQDIKIFKDKINLNQRHEIWFSQETTQEKKAFIILENGKVTAFGFYDWYHQLTNPKILEQLKIQVSSNTKDLENDLKLALIQEDFKTLNLSSRLIK